MKHSLGQSLSDWITFKSGYHIRVPDGVAYPMNEKEVREILDYAKSIDAIIIPYGGGTSVVGHLTVLDSARPVISVDMGKMNRSVHLDIKECLATLLRKLRGSHILFPHWRFPIYQALSIRHPYDLYLLPWQGMTLYCTTDIEHNQSIEEEPRISKEESTYLFEALQHYFPSLQLTVKDAISTFYAPY